MTDNIYEGWARFYKEPRNSFGIKNTGVLFISQDVLKFTPHKRGTFYEITLSEIKEVSYDKYKISIVTNDGSKYSLFAMKNNENLDKKRNSYIYDILVSLKEQQAAQMVRVIEKLAQIMKVSSKISVHMLKELFKLDTGKTYDILYNWATTFGFTVDGDYLLVSEPAVSEFLKQLKGKREERRKEDEETEKIKCLYCGSLVEIDVKYCPQCGNENMKF